MTIPPQDLTFEPISHELESRAWGLSPNHAVAFIMGDEEWPFDELIYEDVTVII